MNDDTALGYVLGTLPFDDAERLESAMRYDPLVAQMVDRARSDIAMIDRGIQLVAKDAGRSAGAARRPRDARRFQSLASAAAVAAVVAGLITADIGKPPGSPVTKQTPPGVESQIMIAPSLDDLIAQSSRIVRGTVTSILDRPPNREARIDVAETFKGAPVRMLAVQASGEWVEQGQQVLLFLVDAEPGLSVSKSYLIEGGTLLAADFTLADLRARLSR